MNATEVATFSQLEAALGNPPFPWQQRLLRQFMEGRVPRALDLPTGLGKTSVMAIWLVARACGAELPRRLVYVVDRRAVVDQATTEAEKLRSWASRPEVAEALGLESGPLPISTLRGQFVDNREWLEDPTSPAIVVGTVDMIGSRLLFEGYACSRKMRPYHAGMLGADTLFVVDESHLVPSFERLLGSVVDDPLLLPTRAVGELVPPVRLLSLSATGRDQGKATFRLDERDRAHPVVRKRLTGSKRVHFETLGKEDKLAKILAQRAWTLATEQPESVRVLIFCNRRDDAEKARAELLKLARKERGSKGAVPGVELFVGGRRVHERTRAARTLQHLGFLAGSERPADHAFVFATSAGEVGVDLDADHMVADVVAWERMVQRLGRVNRRGERKAEIMLVADPKEPFAQSVEALLEILPASGKDYRDAGLMALEQLRTERPEQVAAASTPERPFPPLARATLDAWAMTSLVEHTGRPEVQPWLRGWPEEDERPQTAVVWRSYLPPGSEPKDRRVEAFFDAAPPHVSERLDTDTHRVADWLLTRAAGAAAIPDENPDAIIAWTLDASGSPTRCWTLENLARRHSSRDKRDLVRLLSGALLVVHARLGGLSEEGLLDQALKHDQPPKTADTDGQTWTAELLGNNPGKEVPPPVRFRVELRTDLEAQAEGPWRERLRLALNSSGADEDVTEWLVVEKWRHDGATEDDRSTAGRAQTLAEHQSWTGVEADRIASRLQLPEPWRTVLIEAARSHDEGKRSRCWQRAFNAPATGGPYAKTTGPMNVALLGGYRHELGSVLQLEATMSGELAALPADARALALHLVASHHGFARPTLRTDGCDHAPPSVLAVKARQIALRFSDLQATWGPWGLAWWETLLRAADQRASRKNDQHIESQAPKD